MPLVVLSGLPSSGKSFRASQLRDFFANEKLRAVHVISENDAVPRAGYGKNEYFADSQREKIVRADLKSGVIRHLNKEDLVIFDAGNYIKGYRYEMYCSTKAARVSQCTIFCAINDQQMRAFNCQRSAEDVASVKDNSAVPYTEETLEALKMRFEEPQGNNRWDAPLYTVFPESSLDFEGIYKCLYEQGPPPPNLSTQNAPLSATNYLFELDKTTQTIIQEILQAQKNNTALRIGTEAVANESLKKFTPILLNRLRRQFLNYSKMHTTDCSLERAPQLFIQFIMSNS